MKSAGDVRCLFRVDIGYSPSKGYGAVLTCQRGERLYNKGIKGNSIRQLMRRISQNVCDEEQQQRRFPLEQEQRLIITPENW